MRPANRGRHPPPRRTDVCMQSVIGRTRHLTGDRTIVKLRSALPLLLAAAVAVAGCGSDDKDSKDKDSKDKPKVSAAVEKDMENKQEALDEAKKEFEKNDNDAGACRNLAMAYIAIASPA